MWSEKWHELANDLSGFSIADLIFLKASIVLASAWADCTIKVCSDLNNCHMINHYMKLSH